MKGKNDIMQPIHFTSYDTKTTGSGMITRRASLLVTSCADGAGYFAFVDCLPCASHLLLAGSAC